MSFQIPVTFYTGLTPTHIVMFNNLLLQKLTIVEFYATGRQSPPALISIEALDGGIRTLLYEDGYSNEMVDWRQVTWNTNSVKINVRRQRVFTTLRTDSD